MGVGGGNARGLVSVVRCDLLVSVPVLWDIELLGFIEDKTERDIKENVSVIRGLYMSITLKVMHLKRNSQ